MASVSAGGREYAGSRMTSVPENSGGRPPNSGSGSWSAVDDAGLMFRVRNNDTAALDELVDRYWSAVVSYVRRAGCDHEAAHDIAQEAFVRLWQRRELWDPRGSVRVWLFRTARNLGISERRRQGVRLRWAAARQASERVPRTPLQETEDEELRVAVAAALQRLSSRRREAFILFHLRDFSYREIAGIMGIRQQSVANHLQAALADLRSELARFRPARARSDVAETDAAAPHRDTQDRGDDPHRV